MTNAHRESISYLPPVFVLGISLGCALLTVTLRWVNIKHLFSLKLHDNTFLCIFFSIIYKYGTKIQTIQIHFIPCQQKYHTKIVLNKNIYFRLRAHALRFILLIAINLSRLVHIKTDSHKY